MKRKPIKDLRNDAVDLKPSDVSWSDRKYDHDDDGDGWKCWEAVDCNECGKPVVVEGTCVNEDHQYVNGAEGDCKCRGTITSEGPMMNYFYPLPDRRLDTTEAALAVAHLPLCIVCLDGEYGLALTGGGMDLTWEIAEAYMRLGHLPPAHFSDPPDMARDVTPRTMWVAAGCVRSNRLQAGWAQRRAQRVRETIKRMRDRTAKKGHAA